MALFAIVLLGAGPAGAQKVRRRAIIKAKSDAGFDMMVADGAGDRSQ